MGVSVEASPSPATPSTPMSSAGGGGGGGGGAACASGLNFFGDAASPSSSLFLFRSVPGESVGEASSSKLDMATSPLVWWLLRPAFSFERSSFFFTALSMNSLTKLLIVFSCLELMGAVGSLTRPALKSPRTNFFVTSFESLLTSSLGRLLA